MRWTRNLNLDGAVKPTWELVVLMILLLAVETIGDVAGCVGPGPDYDQCLATCKWGVASVGKDYCNCHPYPFKEEPRP